VDIGLLSDYRTVVGVWVCEAVVAFATRSAGSMRLEPTPLSTTRSTPLQMPQCKDGWARGPFSALEHMRSATTKPPGCDFAT
jgi:hypothetical protein